ncbi:MAG: hypothetical protein LDL41_00750, partial [Coleofasciculus sp. S288]|nr:hypothetical protein [Coleofasciculus sp. S288]
MSIPIIIIHLAEREHLRWILAQAREFNPHSNIILIGDYTSKHYNFIEHEEIGNYFQEALTFQKIYKHRSHNSFSYELFCFQRWFVLKQFMKTKGIEKCFCMDSDVMLYADIEEEQKKFADFDLALYQKWNPHCVFVNSLKNLREFCSFLVELYTNSVKFKALELEFQDRIKNKIGAICDMVAFRSFRDLDPNRIGDLSLILNNSTYDNNINYSEGFEMSNARKNIQFIDNKPFCMHLELGKKIRFNALHLQGYAKQYIQDYFTGDKEKIRDIKLWGINTFDSRDKTNENYQQGKSMIKYVALPLKLGEINLIIFPDWSDSGQSLDSDLERVISAIATHPDSSQITLLVYLGRLSQEEANLA